VVQYRADCDLSTLWQRFGRAARAAGQEATAILLVEKKDTVEERTLRVERAAKRKKRAKEGGTKRKATSQLRCQDKRQVLSDGSPSINQDINGERAIEHAASDESADNSEHATVQDPTQLREDRRAHYKKRPQPKERGKREDRGVEVGSAMDDFINAHVHLRCRRVILALYFENDKTRESPFTVYSHNGSRYVTFNILFQQPTSIFIAILPLRWAVTGADPRLSPSVAISATPTISPTWLSHRPPRNLVDLKNRPSRTLR